MSKNSRAPHVFYASATLMGICLIIQTSIVVMRIGSKTVLDEITAADTCLFTLACLFSYLSLRRPEHRQSEFLERIADFIFLAGLVLLTVMVIVTSVTEIS